ncbi:hypothetical protein HYS93_04690 [Candidatus Daviesbacteria bacterium]|nr:hypothetical protein [Candidatus Daviesbacteria bacterium]
MIAEQLIREGLLFRAEVTDQSTTRDGANPFQTLKLYIEGQTDPVITHTFTQRAGVSSENATRGAFETFVSRRGSRGILGLSVIEPFFTIYDTDKRRLLSDLLREPSGTQRYELLRATPAEIAASKDKFIAGDPNLTFILTRGDSAKADSQPELVQSQTFKLGEQTIEERDRLFLESLADAGVIHIFFDLDSNPASALVDTKPTRYQFNGRMKGVERAVLWNLVRPSKLTLSGKEFFSLLIRAGLVSPTEAQTFFENPPEDFDPTTWTDLKPWPKFDPSGRGLANLARILEKSGVQTYMTTSVDGDLSKSYATGFVTSDGTLARARWSDLETATSED